MSRSDHTSLREEPRPARYVNDGDRDANKQTDRDKLVRLAYRFLWNLSDAEDAVQDALTTAHERSAELREGSKWTSWIARILVRRCHELGRKKTTKRRHEQLFAKQKKVFHDADTGVQLSDSTESVRMLLAQLPRRQREVIVMRHLHGMTYEEIGKVLEISPATGRVHAHAGLDRLRELMLTQEEPAIEPSQS